MDLLKDKLKKWMSQQTRYKEDKANQKADDYEKKANASDDKKEKEKFRDIAQIWREVAEEYRRENEALKRKVDELSEEAKKEAFKKADNFDMDLDFSNDKPTLSVGDSVYNLPQFPTKNHDH